MPGLDEYYRYINKQDKPRKNGAEATVEPAAKNGNGGNGKNGNGKGKKARLPQGPLPGSVEPGVRYVLRNGVTVAVPFDSEEEDALEILTASPATPDFSPDNLITIEVDPEDTEDIDEDEESLLEDIDDDSLVEAPDYMPLLVEAAEPTEVAEAPARPRPARRRESEPMDELSDGDAAALWKRLPRHIQLLVGMTPETKEEPAQKYYSRGFKETRQQLIERLLDPTMTLEDTARVLGVCPTTVRRYTNRGVLPHYRTLGQQRRFRLSDVLAFLEKQQKQAAKRRKALFGDAAG